MKTGLGTPKVQGWKKPCYRHGKFLTLTNVKSKNKFFYIFNFKLKLNTFQNPI